MPKKEKEERTIADFFNKTLKLYNKGVYEQALERFEKLKMVNGDYSVMIVPYIQKCKHVLEIPLSLEDYRHMEAKAVLKHFSWIDRVKYVTGLLAFVSFSYLFGKTEGSPILDIFIENPLVFIMMVIFCLATFLFSPLL